MINIRQLSVIVVVIALVAIIGQTATLTLESPVDNVDIHLWDRKVGELVAVRSTLNDGLYAMGDDVIFTYYINWGVVCVSDSSYMTAELLDVGVWYRRGATDSWKGAPSVKHSGTETLTQDGMGTTYGQAVYIHTLTDTDYDTLDLRVINSFRFSLYTGGILVARKTITGTAAGGSINFAASEPVSTTGDLVVKTGTSDTVFMSMTGPDGYALTDMPVSSQKTFSDLTAGSYKISLARTGYVTNIITVNVLSDKLTTTLPPEWIIEDADPIPGPMPEGGTYDTDAEGDETFDGGSAGFVNTHEYTWSETSIIIAAVGIISAIMLFVFVPLPPNYKALLSAVIVVAALVVALYINTGGM